MSTVKQREINYKKKIEQLERQLEYLRSGEYLNQLKFERNMLEDIVQNGEVSKEDKEFIDMTHRNTELLEENQHLNDIIKKINNYIEDRISVLTVSVDNKAKDEYFNNKCIGGVQELKNIKEILKRE